MTAEVIDYRFRMRRALAATWVSLNDVLLEGEYGYEKDTGKIKIGDGVTAWNDLDYFSSGFESLVAGSHISIDFTDPANPVFSVTGVSPAGYAEGTSFPGSPGLNDKFYRNDLQMLAYWDGSRWLSCTEYSSDLTMSGGTNFTANSAFNRTTVRNSYRPYVTKVNVTTRVASGTNNSTNYWQVDVLAQYVSGGSIQQADLIGTVVDTKTEGVNIYTNHEVTVNAAAPAGITNFYAQANKNGSPGPFVGAVCVYYRLILT